MIQPEKVFPHGSSSAGEKMSFSEQDLEAAKTISTKLRRLLLVDHSNRSLVRGFDKYSGINQPIGSGLYFNTELSGGQLLFALALSHNPAVNEFIKKAESGEIDPEILVKNRVLDGMKILDLGCGEVPSFARTARAMGADVYTADIASADNFNKTKEFEEEQGDLEMRKHLQINLNESNAVEELEKFTGGNFDLVTEAHLSTPSKRRDSNRLIQSFSGREIAFNLLKENGIYFNALSEPEIIKKEK